MTVADNAGVMVINNGSGSATVTVNGEIAGDVGVDVTNNALADSLTITTGANSKIAASGSGFGMIGVRAYNYGTGATNVTLGGEVTATGDDAVHIVNYSDGGLYLNAQKGSKSSSPDYAGLFVYNGSAAGVMEVTLDGETYGSVGAAILAANASSTAAMTLTVGSTAYIDGTAVGLVVANGSAAAGTVQIDAGATIAGGLYGLLLTAPATGTLVVDTSGDISASKAAVQFGWSYFGGPLTGDVTLNIHGGQISGDVVDYDPTGGHSIVNIVGDFTSEGNFDVSDFNVAKGTVFTLGKGYTVSASTDPIDIYGTFLIPEDPLITGDVDVHTDGLLDVQDITTITGFLKNDGTVSISHDATVTADTMQTGTGTLYFGVNSASDHALLTIGSGAADLTGQTIKINVGTGATFTTSDQIKIIDGATTLIGGPSGATSVWDDSPAWEFNIVDGTGITDDSDLYLMLNASAPPPPIDGAIALATLTMADNAMNLTSERLSSVRSGRTGISAGGYYPAGSRRVWTQALGQLIHQGARNGISGYSARLMGASIGVDTDKYLGNGILGLSFNYGNSHIDSRNTFSTDTDIDSYQLTFYGDYNWPTGWYVNGMTAYAFNSNDTARHNADGAGATAAADFNSQQLGMRGEFGRVYNAGRGYFIPFALADWTYYTAQNYTETGAGSANLHVESKDLHQADLGIGGKLGMTMALANDGVLKPEVHAVYRRDLLGNNLTTSQAYVSGGAPSFTVESPDPARDKFTLGTQVRYFSPDNLELSASYDVEFKEDYVSHTGLVRAGWRF